MSRIITLLLLLPLVACAEPETTRADPEPTEHNPIEDEHHAANAPGPYAVGVRFMQAWDTDRDLPIPITVWYPAEEDDRTPKWLFARGVEDAAVADGDAFPVVLYSHGNIEVPHTSIFLADQLASHGYVVAAPAHRYDTLTDYVPDRFVEHTLYRTRDLPRTLDLLLAANEEAADPLFGRLDPERIAATGHSWGAVTTELLSGWVMSGGDPMFQDGAVANDFDWPLAARDERIKVGVSMATCVADLFDDTGWDRIDVPMLYIGGTADAPHCNVDAHAAVKAGWTPDAQVVRVENATHYAFTNMCDIDPANAELYSCASPPRSYDEVRAITNELVTDFLGVHLLGDDRYGASLDVETY